MTGGTYRIGPMALRPDTTATLAVQDRGMAAILANADPAHGLETAGMIYTETHPPIILGPVCIPTISN